jgi:hypothetical protein
MRGQILFPAVWPQFSHLVNVDLNRPQWVVVRTEWAIARRRLAQRLLLFPPPSSSPLDTSGCAMMETAPDVSSEETRSPQPWLLQDHLSKQGPKGTRSLAAAPAIREHSTI